MIDTYFTVCGILGIIFVVCIVFKSLAGGNEPKRKELTKEQMERYERERKQEHEELCRKIDDILAKQKEWERAQGWNVDD